MKNFWCEVDLNKVEHNVNLIKGLGNNKKVIGVVKGNAYGLGIEKITEFLEDKVDCFAVSDINEAKRINTSKEILLLSPLITLEDFNCDLNNLIYTIDNEEILENINKEKEMKIHIYVDTGMSRMGIKVHRLDCIIEHIKEHFKNITIDGIYTHLHNTKNNKYTLKQVQVFKDCVMKYKEEIQHIHCLNSPGLLNEEIRKACEFTTAVRCGNIIYGYDGLSIGFKKVYKFNARTVNKHFVKKGDYIGYGCSFKAKRDMYIGVLGFGNIEHFGFSRDIKNNIFYDVLKVIYNHIKFRPVIFSNNKGIKILGKPNMNITLIDLEDYSMDSIFHVDITPILADSMVEKVYTKDLSEL